MQEWSWMGRKRKRPHIKRPSIKNINKPGLQRVTASGFVVEHEQRETGNRAAGFCGLCGYFLRQHMENHKYVVCSRS